MLESIVYISKRKRIKLLSLSHPSLLVLPRDNHVAGFYHIPCPPPQFVLLGAESGPVPLPTTLHGSHLFRGEKPKSSPWPTKPCTPAPSPPAPHWTTQEQAGGPLGARQAHLPLSRSQVLGRGRCGAGLLTGPISLRADPVSPKAKPRSS